MCRPRTAGVEPVGSAGTPLRYANVPRRRASQHFATRAPLRGRRQRTQPCRDAGERRRQQGLTQVICQVKVHHPANHLLGRPIRHAPPPQPRLPKRLFGGGMGPLALLFQPNPPGPPLEGGSKGWLPCFSCIFYDKPLALSQSVLVTVPVTVPLQCEGLLLWLSAVLIHPCPPPHPISKLEPKISDICIEDISVWPLEPLSEAPPP